MPLQIAVLQHVECEPPGAYGPVLEKYATVDTFLLGRDPLPQLDAYDGLVAMGGPMGTYDVEQYSWLRGEIAAIGQALDAGVAMWGVCLGAQLLAAAAGATVAPGPMPEVGVDTVTMTAPAWSDPVFGSGLGDLTVLQWHQDTFDLPVGAELLASSNAYQNQAFRLGRSYGLQFHLECGWDLAADWLLIDAYRNSLELAGGPGASDRLRRQLLEHEDSMASTAQTLLSRWLELLANGSTDNATVLP